MEPIFDDAWRVRAMAGDPDAARALAVAALRPLYAFCLYRVGRNHPLCEEVVQEVLLGALRGIERYAPARGGNDIFPWLAGLARNEIQRVLARERAEASLQTLWANMDRNLLALCARIDTEPFGDDALKREETRELVNTTMSQLPPRYREALEAKYVQGRSVRDIAGALAVPEKTVESLLTRARDAFRETFRALARNLGAEVG